MSFHADHGLSHRWWSFNTTIGQPYVLGRRPNATTREEKAWEYDNTSNSKPFHDQWTESWTNTSSATLTVSSSGAHLVRRQ